MSRNILIQSSLYYNAGDGFNEDNKIVRDAIINDCGISTAEVEFNLSKIPDEAFEHEFRFDPFEGYFSVFYEINDGFNPVNNEKQIVDNIVFFTIDPIYYFRCNKKNCLIIKFSLEILSNFKIDNVINIKSQLNSYYEKRFSWFKDIDSRINKKRLSFRNYDKLTTSYPEVPLGKNPKILVVVHHAAKHGPGLLSLNIVKTMKELTKFDPIVLILMDGELNTEFEKYAPVYSIDLDGFGHNTRKYLLDIILSQIKMDGCDVAICNSLTTSIISDSLKKHEYKITTIVHELPEIISINQLENAKKKALKNSDKLVFASNYARDAFLSNYKFNKDKTYLCPQGLYKPSSLHSFNDKKWLLDNKTKLILGCGNGFYIKGVDIFVDTAIKILMKDQNFEFIWLGNLDSVEDRAGCLFAKKKINYYGYDKKIKFIDFTDDIDRYFNKAHLLFLSSRIDCYPSVVLEALDRYTPVAIFDNVGGAQDIINKDNGIVIPYADTQTAAKHIHKFLSGNKKYEKIADNCKKSVSKYSIKEYVNNILDILNM